MPCAAGSVLYAVVLLCCLLCVLQLKPFVQDLTCLNVLSNSSKSKGELEYQYVFGLPLYHGSIRRSIGQIKTDILQAWYDADMAWHMVHGTWHMAH